MGVMTFGAVWALTLAGGVQVDPPADRIYGRVTTVGGDVLEGWLRWDRNEASWADFLDGQKEIPWENLAEAEELDPEYAEARRRERSIEAFGVRITWDVDDDAQPTRASAAVRFGRLSRLVVLDERRVRLHLRDESEVELRASSSDLGRSMRALVVDDARRGVVELRWRDLDRVDFMAAPAGAAVPRDGRLHGTLRTRSGLELTGYVAWDIDEVFESDELDGESPDGVDHTIAFGDVAAIERESGRRARVVLRSGEELILGGTNDVNRDNRGIEVTDAALRAIVPWDELDVLTLHPPTGPVATYAHFGGAEGGLLRGTVLTSAGDRVTGTVRWDNDERAGWELLDGRADGVDIDIELGRIHAIRKRDDHGVVVTLLDGRELVLEGSNDVDRTNKGIFVTPDGGRTVLVKWTDFDALELAG